MTTTALPFRQTALSLALSAFVAGTAFVSSVADAHQRTGSEFRVNTVTAGDQYRPTVATDANGDFVVVWTDAGRAAIYGQRYSRDGSPLGAEFKVSTGTVNTASAPRVAMDADGDFVVAYTASGTGDADGVFAQRYDKTGTPQGTEFRVNTYTSGTQGNASIAMDADGDFVIAWSSNGQDTSGEGSYAQRYNAGGVVQGSEFRANTYTSGNQTSPVVAMSAAGDFVIAWTGSSQDGSSLGVYAQRYNAAGTTQGSEFRVNTYTSGVQTVPAIGMDSNGDFVITWMSNGQDGSAQGIYGQRYNAAGVPQGPEFRVNTYTSGTQHYPTLALDADGDFVIAWHSNLQDGSGYGIYAQRYSASGAAQGAEFRVNAYTTSSQAYPSIAMDADGDFVIAWYSSVQDGSDTGIYAQRYSADTVGPSLSASAGAPTNSAGVYRFTATYCLKAGQPTLSALNSYTLALSNNNSLDSRTTSAYAVPGQTAVPPGGVGSQQNVGLSGSYADASLSTGECVAVPYAIGLTNNDRFSFSVRIRGDNGGTPAAP